MRVKICVYSLVLMFISITIIAESWMIAYIEGETHIHRGSTQEIADFGSRLQPGDTVSTGAASLAILESSRGSKIKMKENTRLRLDSLEENVRVHLQRGGVFSRIVRLLKDSFTVTTPSVAAGVRGTEFFIAYGLVIEDEADIWLCVNEGSVAVRSAQQEVLVQAGEGVNIINGSRITEPRFYPWTRGLNWNTDPEAGNVRDTTDLIALYYDLLDIDYD
ncbi:FecR family protein [Marispirochaeta aestuarii]|uniref:FecR family protein n=1 Tax=Marispirochaeta aestuarii TaxID=1963862 RepID=UPI0029C635CA|nr:FecR family protein [Marispirochaeta aestuarii]